MYLGVNCTYLVGYQSYIMYYFMNIMYSHVIDDEYYEMCSHAMSHLSSLGSFPFCCEVYRV